MLSKNENMTTEQCEITKFFADMYIGADRYDLIDPATNDKFN